MNPDSGSELFAWLGLFVDALTPIVLGLLGLRAHAYVDRLARKRRYSEVEAEWRLEVFRELANSLNDIYCYFNYQGNWLSMTPDDATRSKRTSDRLVYMNRFLWSPDFLEAYDGFGRTVFVQNRGPGRPFAFRANVERHKENPNWDDSWEDRFVPEKDRVRRVDFREAYDRMMALAVRDLGVVSEPN